MKKHTEYQTVSFAKELCCVTAFVAILALCVSCGRNSNTAETGISADFYASDSDNAENTELGYSEGEVEDPEEIDETGIGVSEVEVNSERHLIMTLSDGSTVDAGYVGGETSTDGYYVTFVDYNDHLLKFEIVEKGGDATPPTDPSRENHTFAGWDKSFSGIRQNTVITATYTELIKDAEFYTVIFADYDGTTLSTQEVEAGKSAVPPAGPSREGYSFVGWDASYNCIVEDTTFIAQYSEGSEALILAGDVSAQVGDTGIEVPIEFKNSPGIAGISLEVGYDNTALSLTGVTYGEKFVDCGEAPNLEATPVSLVWTNLEETDGDAVYAVLSFSVLETAVSGENYAISLSFDEANIFDIDEENVSFALKDGSITVN